MQRTGLSRAAWLVLGAATTGAAHAQSFPAKPIRIVVPYAAGGAVDMVARIVGQKLAEQVGRTVIVENRPGASTNIASELVARAAPDGYTLLIGSTAQATNMTLYRKLPYDTLRDFSPVTQIGFVPQVLTMHPSLPAGSVKALIAIARSRPGQMSYASGGNGSSQHLTGELFKMTAGLDITHVPYKGGAPALVDVIGGQVAYMFINTAEVIPHVRSGRVKALAITMNKRSAVLPNTPTFAESGMPGFESVAWWGVLAPAGTPRDVVAKLHSEIVTSLGAADLKERFASLGAEIVGSSSEAFAAFVREEIDKWGKVVRALSLKAD